MRSTGIVAAALLALAAVSAAAQQAVPVRPAAPAVPPAERTIRLDGMANDPAYGYARDKPIALGGHATRDFDRRLDVYFRLLRGPEGQPLRVMVGEACCQVRAADGEVRSLQVVDAGPDGRRAFRFYVDGFAEAPLSAPRGLLGTRDEASAEAIDGALDNLRAGFVDGAVQRLAPLAAAGDTLAQYHLGRVLADRRDFAGAYRWFLAAAEAGHPASQATVAAMLDRGTGVAADRAAAERWRREAAAGGHTGALLALALAALSDKPDAAATARAAAMLRRAADLGDPAAQAAYGAMLAQGRGVPMDLFQGLVWLHLAKEAGDANAGAVHDGLAAGQTAQTMARVEQAARDWKRRPAPQPAVAR
jgi:TPR repeat protein